MPRLGAGERTWYERTRPAPPGKPRKKQAPPMPAPRPDIADLLEVDVPPGGKVITVSDLHLPPVRTDVSGRSCETLARHLAEEQADAHRGAGRGHDRAARLPRVDGHRHPAPARGPVRGAAGGDRARRAGHLRHRQPRQRPGLGRQGRGRGAGDDRRPAVPGRRPDPGRRPEDPGGARPPARPVQLLLRRAQPAGHPAGPPHRAGGPAADRVARPGLGRRGARDGGPDRLPVVHRLPAGLPQAGPPPVVADRHPARDPDRGPGRGGSPPSRPGTRTRTCGCTGARSSATARSRTWS